MKALDAYRLSLTEGLTFKEAAFKYGLRTHTLWTAGRRANLPLLKSAHCKRRSTMFKSMTNEQLATYREKLEQELQAIKDQQASRSYITKPLR
jgi:cytochrome P450